MKTVDFLDAVKARHRLSSDYQLAKLLRWNTQRISMYRHTPRELDDDACVQIAAALEIPPAYVMACIAAARAKSADIKRHWLAAAKLLKTGTAAVIVMTVLAVSQVAPSSPAGFSAGRLNDLYIMRPKRRRRGWRPPPRIVRRAARVDRRRRRRPRKARTVTAGSASLPEIGKTA